MKTSYSDSDFAIEWLKVKRIYTTTEFLGSVLGGHVYRGNPRSQTDYELFIFSKQDTLATVAVKDVVILEASKMIFSADFQLP